MTHITVDRGHPSPNPKNFSQLIEALEQRHFSLNIKNSKTLADSLDLINDNSDPYFNTIVRILVTRCMTQAVYFSSGSVPPEQFHHYGNISIFINNFRLGGANLYPFHFTN